MDKKVHTEQEKIIEEIKERQEKAENKIEETCVNLEEWKEGQEKTDMETWHLIQAVNTKVEEMKHTYAGASNEAKVEEVLQDFKRSMEGEREEAKKMLE